MQDVHEILGGGAGRIFGDRRLRAAAQGHLHQALNCPRCDSSNTKFCYYNNYNLSQPRHFCKNCRRYWTKGGVLRNVPVGGGCRKSKRSSKRKASASPPPRTGKERHKSSSRSSSESTSANAASTGTKAQSAGAVGSGKAIGAAKTTSEVAGSDYSSSSLFKFSEQPAPYNFPSPARIASCSGANSNFEPLNSLQAATGITAGDPGAVGTVSEIGGFVSVMDGDQHKNLLGFCEAAQIDESTPFAINQQNQTNNNHLLLQNPSGRNWQKEKFNGAVDDWGPGILDETVCFDLLPNSKTSTDVTLSGPDWNGVPGGSVGGGGGHLGMFDLTPGSDWSQWSQWNESDHHLYLPP